MAKSTLLDQLMAEVRSMDELREQTRSAEFRADQAEYEIFTRAKYSADDKQAMLDKGQALANANGDPSYFIADREDLEKAIKAVGRGGSDHDGIRAYIITRAAALSLESLIPDNWNADGSLKADDAQENSEDLDTETRDDTKVCPTCDGEKTILAGNRKCPDCNGTGTVPADTSDGDDASRSLELPVMTWIDQATAEATRNVNHEPDYRAAPDDADDRVTAHREQQVVAEILALPEEDREAMIEAAPEPDEVRAALASYGDIESAVENALSVAYGKTGEYCDIWVCDAGDTGAGEERWAVFTSYVDPPGQGSFKVTFNCADDGSIVFTGNPVAVARVTTFEPIPAPVAPDLTADSAARSAQMLALEAEAGADAEVRSRAKGNTTKRADNINAFGAAKAAVAAKLAGGRIKPETVASQIAAHKANATAATAAGDHPTAASESNLALAKQSALSEHQAIPAGTTTT